MIFSLLGKSVKQTLSGDCAKYRPVPGFLGHLAHIYVEWHQAASDYSSMGYDNFPILDWHSAPVQFARYCGNFDGNFFKVYKNYCRAFPVVINLTVEC